MRTERRTPSPPPTRRNSPAGTHIATSAAASATTCRRKRRRHSLKPWSKSTATPPHENLPALAGRAARRGLPPELVRPGERRHGPVRRCYRLAQFTATGARRAARKGRAGRLLDLHLHQLAPHPSLRARLGGQIQG